MLDCIEAMWQLQVLLEADNDYQDQDFYSLLLKLYRCGDHRRYVSLVYFTALLLPYEATGSLSKFLDAISSYLRLDGAAGGPDEQTYLKIGVI